MKTQVWMQGLGQIIAITLSSNCMAQVVPDQTLPVGERSQVSGNPNIQIDGGAARGSNLFHSFQQFSIPTGSSASFNNAANIANVINRVTGSSISNIDGLIRANGTANVFLINPNGILFGANAQLAIGGSFLVSTANSLKFADGFEFNAKVPQSSPLLTVSVPIGLQYGSTPGAIQVQGATLQVPNGQTLTLAGGAVTVNGGQLFAPGGRVELAGVAAPGQVELAQQGQELRLSVPEGLARADVAIDNDANVNVRADGGGSIAITARNLTVTGLGTRVSAGIAVGLGTVGAQAGDIDINTTEAVNLDESFVNNVVRLGGIGNAGDINITTGKLSLTNGAQISASTRGQGDAGNITINAREAVSFDGEDSNGLPSGAYSEVGFGAIGQGGDISITTGNLSITKGVVNSAEISTDTFGQGNAGNIIITARDAVFFDGSSNITSSVSFGAVGQGGDISLTTGSIALTNGAQMAAVTIGQGNAGNITINARDTVSFDGTSRNALFTSGVGSIVGFVEAIGRGGNISITTGTLSITNGAAVSATTFGQGNAGTITVTARDAVFIDGVDSNRIPSGIFSRVGSQANGQGGKITVNTGLFSITNRGELTASSESQGNAGNLEVNARQLRLDNQGSIQAQTGSGQGGNISLQVRDLLLLRRGSLISTTAGTAQAGGDGGNITFDGKFIVAVPQENSDITANAFSGRGGNVRITAQGIFGIEPRFRETALSDITASSEFGIRGNITLNTPNVDLNRGLIALPTGLIDPNALIANSCIARRTRQGRFVITGTGGLATQPDDLANVAFPTYELVSNPAKAETTEKGHSSQSPTSITEPDGVYRLTNGELILGRSCR